MERSVYYPLIVAGALVAANLPGEEREPARPAAYRASVREAPRLAIPGWDDPVYALHDAEILEQTAYWNAQFASLPGYEPLDPEVVKAMVLKEAGGDLDAFAYDPLQIANAGDFALHVLRDGLEVSVPPGGYADLQDIQETPRGRKTVQKTVKGEKVPVEISFWDYGSHEHRITPELSIRYGIRWLWQKNMRFDEVVVEDHASPLLSYTVQPGDCLDTIAKKQGTTVETLKTYSDIDNPSLIRPGQLLHFKPARRSLMVVGLRGWDKALEDYNSRASYAEDVMDMVESIDGD